MTWITLCLSLLASVAAVPPLTPAQHEQLDTARDGGAWVDEGALYPLLANAGQWSAGDESGAAVPDWQALPLAPVAARGQLYLIEGVLRATPDIAPALSRPGSWDGRMQRWLMTPDQRPNEPFLVYLVNPPSGARLGQEVRLPARFFKLWTPTASDGTPGKTIPVFVGSGAKMVRPSAMGGRLSSSTLVILVVVLAMFLLTLFRLLVRGGPGLGWWGRRRLPSEPIRQEDEELDESGPPLPDEPVQALKELEKRRKQRRETPNHGDG